MALLAVTVSFCDLATAQKMARHREGASSQAHDGAAPKATPKGATDGEPPVRFVLGLAGGYGKLDAYHSYYQEEHLGTFGTAVGGVSLGVAGFTGPHIQLAGELVVFGHSGVSEIARYEPTYASQNQQPGDFSFTTVLPLGGRLAMYFQEYRGPFISLAFHGGLGFQSFHGNGPRFAGAYCGEIGYALLNVLPHARLSLAIGYERTGTASVDINGDNAYITAAYPFAMLRLEP
jgi:hypothetical protein